MTYPPDNKTLAETDIDSVVEKVMGGKTNVILDATMLTSLMSCGRLTDFRFNHNFQAIGGKSNSLECGSLVHTFLEYYYKNIIKGYSKDKAMAFAFVMAEMYIKGCHQCQKFVATDEVPKPLCGHKPNEFPGLFNTPKDSEGYKTGWQWVLDTLDQYCAFYRNDHWVPLEIEVVKKEILYEDDEVRILWKAKIDMVSDTNQGIFSVDHKTMKQRRDTNSMNNQFMGQCFLMKTQKVFLNKIGFQTSLKPEEKFTRPPVSYSSPRLFEWQSETLPYWAKVMIMYAETGHWPPNFTQCESKYGNCPFYENICSADPGMREEELKKYFIIGDPWNPTNDDEV